MTFEIKFCRSLQLKVADSGHLHHSIKLNVDNKCDQTENMFVLFYLESYIQDTRDFKETFDL